VKSVATSVTCLFLLLILGQSETPDSSHWNDPVKPFRIAGNLYYVGAQDLTSFLLTTDQGHILLDGGEAATAPQVERNIRALGFKVMDVKILLNSHAHFDHAGGLAELKRTSGAIVVASEPDRYALETGDRNDFAWGDRFAFDPVKVDRTVADGETIHLGNAKMTAHLTPGHTKGCTTWTTTVSDQKSNYNVVFVCSVTVPGYVLVNNSTYPNIVSDYKHSFEVLQALPCDIFLASHGAFFGLTAKRASIGSALGNPFVNGAEYQRFVRDSQREFDKERRSQMKKLTKTPS
jgi:metallo-beta-lactamase class B